MMATLKNTISNFSLILLYLLGLSGNIHASETSLIYRAVLINKSLWIVKHPSGAEIFHKDGTVPSFPDKFDMSKIIDVSKHQNSILVATQSTRSITIHTLTPDLLIKSSQSFDLLPGENVFRLISHNENILVLTDQRIVNLSEKQKSVRLVIDLPSKDEKLTYWFKKERMVSNHFLSETEIYLGVSIGEFGGGYVSFNLKTGTVKFSENLGSATDLIASRLFTDPFYISTGCTHIAISSGAIYSASLRNADTVFNGDNYVFKLLELESESIIPELFSDGVPIMGMFQKDKDLCAVTEQNYIINITSPQKAPPGKIEYQRYGNYYLHWISDTCVIVNCEYFLPYISARCHVRVSDFAAEDENLFDSSINQTIIVARED